MPTHCSPASQGTSTQADRIREVAGSDPYVRLRLDEAGIREVFVEETDGVFHAVAWSTHRQSGQRWGIALGEDAAAISGLLECLDQRAPLDGVTVPADAFWGLPDRLSSPDPGHWSLWELDRLARPDPGQAIALDPADPRIAGLLAHSPSAHVFPGDRAAHWAGVEESGDLLSVAAQYREGNGYAHVVSVCTHPSARGRRLAEASIGLLVEQARSSGCTGVLLEMYAANEPGRRAYRRMGFAEVGQYRSGLLAHALPAAG